MVIWERNGNNYRLTSGYDDLMWQFGKKIKRPVLFSCCAKGEIRVHQEVTERMHFSGGNHNGLLGLALLAMLGDIEGG